MRSGFLLARDRRKWQGSRRGRPVSYTTSSRIASSTKTRIARGRTGDVIRADRGGRSPLDRSARPTVRSRTSRPLAQRGFPSGHHEIPSATLDHFSTVGSATPPVFWRRPPDLDRGRCEREMRYLSAKREYHAFSWGNYHAKRSPGRPGSIPNKSNAWSSSGF